MGRRNVLVEGVSGSGKTSVATELERRGHQVVHGDRQLKYRGDPVTGAPVTPPERFADDDARAEWVHQHLCWPADEVLALAASREAPVTFFCGGCRNLAQLRSAFDLVVVLEVDRDTLVRRLDQRDPDEWAGRGRDAERRLVLRRHATRADLPAGVHLDATRPLAEVVDDLLRLATA